MASPSASPTQGTADPVPIAPAMSPEALERHRFERDRSQALTIVAVVAFPIAAFGIIDAMVAKSGLRLAVLWSIRGAALLAVWALWHWLRDAPTRARFERLLFNAQLIGVALAVGSHYGRGPASLVQTRLELLSVVVYYFMIPGRTRRQAIPAVILSVASLSMVLYWHSAVSGPELVSHVVCFALANVLGVLVTRHRLATAAEEERAWRTLALAHARLQRTVAELRSLRAVVPICPHCQKVRNAKHAWQQLEAYVAARGDVEFSPILCPTCLEQEFGAVFTPSPTAP